MADHCTICDDTGWMRVVTIDFPWCQVTRCICRTKPAQTMTPFAAVMDRSPQLKAVIDEEDRRVAEIIQKCKGAANAVTSAEIAGAVWPGSSMDPKHSERLRRMVTASVERLCDLAKIPICATKAPPYGYFVPADGDQGAQELRDMHERLKREGIKRLVRCQLYGRDANLVRELEGQLQL